MNSSVKTIWELLWDYDPNGLIVLNQHLRITIVNSAFCEMFHMDREKIIGQHVGQVLDDAEDFQRVWDQDLIVRGQEQAYPKYGLYVKKVMFAIKDQGILAGIMSNITHEYEQKQQLLRLREQTLQNVSQVVDQHMKVAQEIAGLLGETTARTKVSLLKLAQMLKQETL